MDNYIEWQGTERSLEDILIWWAKQFEWKHSPDCKNEFVLDCCEGASLPTSWYGLSGGTAGPAGRDMFWLAFVEPSGEETRMSAGDRIYYRGEGVFELVPHG